MARFTAFLDASVLYPAAIRDILLETAVSDLYFAKWSNAVHDEWIEAVLRNCSDLRRELVERTRSLMNASVRDALVVDFEPPMEGCPCPIPTIGMFLRPRSRAAPNLIVTANLRDFAASELHKWNIEALHPDEFLQHQFHLNQPAFLNAVRTIRMRLKNPLRPVADYLDILRQHGLLATVSEIEPFNQFI